MANIESRRDHCICYRNRKKVEQWQCDYCGVMTLANGDKYWVYAYEQQTTKGEPCFGIKIVPYTGEERR
jgi:hypothetical protein